MMDQSRAILTTTGRRSGRPHSVELKVVVYEGEFYFSRHRPDSDWFLNAMANRRVTMQWMGRTVTGEASPVTSESLERKISRMKYPGQARAEERRAVLRISPM